MITNVLKEINFTGRKEAPFVTTYNPAVSDIKKILMKHWHLITVNQNLNRIFPYPPFVSYKRNKSLKDFLVRTKNPKEDY